MRPPIDVTETLGHLRRHAPDIPFEQVIGWVYAAPPPEPRLPWWKRFKGVFQRLGSW